MAEKIENPYGLLNYPYIMYKGSQSFTEFAIVYLHGTGDRGADFSLLKRWSLPYVIEYVDSYAYQTICPVCPANERWKPKKLSEFLIRLKDSGLKGKRIILTGYSLGATGAYDLQSLYPDLVNGLVVVAGRTRKVNIKRLASVPILAFYGELDERLKSSKIGKLKDRINEHGGQMDLIIYPDKEHVMANEAYSDKRFYEWVEKIGKKYCL